MNMVEGGCGDSKSSGSNTEDSRSTSDSNWESDHKSADALIFGSAPAQLFNDVAIKADAMMNQELSSLPLLPRVPAENDNGKIEQIYQNEAKLPTKLRNFYKRNFDRAETYCHRNIFTIQNYSKTKRRKILERFVRCDEDLGHAYKMEGALRTSETSSNHQENNVPTLLPTKLNPPGPEQTLPSPEQIIAKDKEIVGARRRLQQEKQRQTKLSGQLTVLNNALKSLWLVKKELEKDLGEDFIVNNKIPELHNSVRVAVQGQNELRLWNNRASEVIQMLDKIKAEREASLSDNHNTNREERNLRSNHMREKNEEMEQTLVKREHDEIKRKKMWIEMCRITESSEIDDTRAQVSHFVRKLGKS